MYHKACFLALGLLVLGFFSAAEIVAGETEKQAEESKPAGSQDPQLSMTQLPAPEGAKPLPKPDRVWVDAKRGLVMVDGHVSLREGYLEMFACITGTKEHESVVAVDSRAYVVHAALLAIGAEPGRPVQFRPKYTPASGTEIEIEVRWQDEHGRWKSVPAQQWVLHGPTKKVMSQNWVFAGSGFWTDKATGEKHYQAESGDFICVSNFSTAMLDIPVESSQTNEELLFVANSEQIPPLGTPVRLVLKRKASVSVVGTGERLSRGLK